MIKVETINQKIGFGYDEKKSALEHFFSSGFTKGMEGVVASKRFDNVDDTFTGSLLHGTQAQGYLTSGQSSYLMNYWANQANGGIYQAPQTLSSSFEYAYRPQTNFNGRGLLTDPKGRLIYPSKRYIGLFDPTASNYTTGTVNMTNGSATVTGVGTTFTSGMATNKRVFRIIGEDDFYEISTFNSTTEIVLDSNYSGSTDTGLSYIIYEAWTDENWDVGSNMTNTYIPSTFFESTALFLRDNKVISINVDTDSMNTSAFTLPDNFEPVEIEANSEGILIAGNFENRGVLILWDNFSIRSIAPWIHTHDKIIAMGKIGSGWYYRTSKGIYYTNGYSTQTLAENFLNIEEDPFSTVLPPESSTATGTKIILGMATQRGTRRHKGVYTFDTATREFEMTPLSDVNSYSADLTNVFYDGENLYASSGGLFKLNTDEVPATSYFISNPIGQNSHRKYAEGVKVPLITAMSERSSTQVDFTIACYIYDMRKQMATFKSSNNTGTTTTIAVNESSGYQGAVGDLVQILEGDNYGEMRTITSIANAGTASAEWTVNTAFSNSTGNSVEMQIWKFRLVDTNTYSDVGYDLPEVYFNVKNKIKAKKFMVMFEVRGATVPIEILPWEFVYDDLGALQD